jgi:PHD/YefM family antitoxin component YafN of YafNO toxin-antitoxin module
MYKAMTTMPVSALRTRQASIISQLRENPILLTQRGRGAGVLVHPDQWNEIIELLEEYEDILTAKNKTNDTRKMTRRAGSAKHLGITMADDFDEPLEDFTEYMS